MASADSGRSRVFHPSDCHKAFKEIIHCPCQLPPKELTARGLYQSPRLVRTSRPRLVQVSVTTLIPLPLY